MKKKIVIFILPLKLREIDIHRFDINEIEKKLKVKVEIHEVLNFLYPGFEKAFSNTIKDRRLKSFNSFFIWKKNLEKKIKVYDNILIINLVESINLASIKFNFYLKKQKKVKVLGISNLQAPSNTQRRIINQIKIFFFTIIYNPKKIINYLKQKLFIYLSSKLKLYPDFMIKTGRKFKNVNKKIKVFSGNSYDYNLYLKTKPKNINLKNYGLYLEAPSPLYLGDSYFDGVKLSDLGTPDIWFKSLNRFFNLIEKYKKIKIKIVAHPKVKHKNKYPPYYFGREILKLKLPEVAKNSKIIISRDSVGASFAAIHNKPAVFIFTDEFTLKKNNFLENQNFFANSLGTEAINIDANFDEKKIKKLFSFNRKVYKEYVKNYLSERNDKKNNYEIISDILKQL